MGDEVLLDDKKKLGMDTADPLKSLNNFCCLFNQLGYGTSL